jgi:hypothetical protein
MPLEGFKPTIPSVQAVQHHKRLRPRCHWDGIHKYFNMICLDVVCFCDGIYLQSSVLGSKGEITFQNYLLHLQKKNDNCVYQSVWCFDVILLYCHSSSTTV